MSKNQMTLHIRGVKNSINHRARFTKNLLKQLLFPTNTYILPVVVVSNRTLFRLTSGI